jgi:signal transduction histidine kinase
MADENLLGHILKNLLGNAVNYSRSGSNVRFAVERQGNNAVFQIGDEGIGISDSDTTHLFTSFQRGANVGDLPGSGLGLVIVKRCVDLHGGNILVRSRLNEGTQVTVSLPLFPEATAAAAAEKARKPRARLKPQAKSARKSKII